MNSCFCGVLFYLNDVQLNFGSSHSDDMNTMDLSNSFYYHFFFFFSYVNFPYKSLSNRQQFLEQSNYFYCPAIIPGAIEVLLDIYRIRMS